MAAAGPFQFIWGVGNTCRIRRLSRSSGRTPAQNRICRRRARPTLRQLFPAEPRKPPFRSRPGSAICRTSAFAISCPEADCPLPTQPSRSKDLPHCRAGMVRSHRQGIVPRPVKTPVQSYPPHSAVTPVACPGHAPPRCCAGFRSFHRRSCRRTHSGSRTSDCRTAPPPTWRTSGRPRRRSEP